MDLSGKDFHATMKMLASEGNLVGCPPFPADGAEANLPLLPGNEAGADLSNLSSYNCLGASNSQDAVSSPSSVTCGENDQKFSALKSSLVSSPALREALSDDACQAQLSNVSSQQNILYGDNDVHNISSYDHSNLTKSQGNDSSTSDGKWLDSQASSLNMDDTNDRMSSVCYGANGGESLHNGHSQLAEKFGNGHSNISQSLQECVEATEMRPKQRRKSRKPLKSSIRYVQAERRSPSPVTTELSPPPAMTSPLLLSSTPPVSMQAPLSPPLSDMHSSISSLSPCSSVNSDESKCGGRAPLPKLLPIDGWPASNAVLSKPKTDNSPSRKLESSGSPENLDLPPPPPYPKDTSSNAEDHSLAARISSSINSQEHTMNDHNRTEDSSEARPPPPPYHSHFFSHHGKKPSSDPDNCNGFQEDLTKDAVSTAESLPTSSNSFWSAVNLPSALSISSLSSQNDADKIRSNDNDASSNAGSDKSLAEADSNGVQLGMLNSPASVAMLLQRLAATSSNSHSQQISEKSPSQTGYTAVDGDDLTPERITPVPQSHSVNHEKQPKDSLSDNSNCEDKNNLSSFLNDLIARNVRKDGKLSRVIDTNARTPALLLSDAKSLEKSLQLSQSAGGLSTSLPNRATDSSPPSSDDIGIDLSKRGSPGATLTKEQQVNSPDNASAMAAFVAAMQGSLGLPNPLMSSESSSLAGLLSGNMPPDLANYAALAAPGVDLSTLAASFTGLPGQIFPNPATTDTKANVDKSNSPFDKAVLESPGLNNLGNMAALSYLLQQQQQLQLESAGLRGGAGGVAPALNSLASLPPLAGLSVIPGLNDISLQQAFKKMRYGSDGTVPTKRKPRSSNHTKSFHCSLCSKRFSLKEELEDHMLTHTSDELGNESYMQKSFACTECSFRTKYKFCLQRHMHIHSGEKPLVCPYCRYRSISKVSYDNHIRTHTGEKPFTCPYCSYKSSFKNNLTKHIKTHTGTNKPYTCNKCSCCFSSQMQLKTHMRLHMDPSGTHNCNQCLYTCMSRFELDCHMRSHLPI